MPCASARCDVNAQNELEERKSEYVKLRNGDGMTPMSRVWGAFGSTKVFPS
jgi:hypothetical protein